MANFMSLIPSLSQEEQQSKTEAQNIPGQFQEQSMQEAEVLPGGESEKPKSSPKKTYSGEYNQPYSEPAPVEQRQKDDNGNTITLTPEQLDAPRNGMSDPENFPDRFDPTQPQRAPQQHSGNNEYDDGIAQNMADNAFFSKIQTSLSEPKYDDPTTWSPQYTDMGWTDQAARNVSQGGGVLLSGIGDTLQMIPLLNGSISMVDSEADGSVVSRMFQEIGENIQNAQAFKNYIPKDLEELEWGDLFNKQLYSTHVAKMLPDAIFQIFVARGLGSLVAKGTGAAVKALGNAGGLRGAATYGKGVTNIAGGAEVFGSGKGVMGAMLTTEGLTAMGNGVISGLAGGVGMNLMVGLRNASELVNTHKDTVIPGTDIKVFTEDDLAEMALNSVKTNAYYIPLDIASLGMTYGGGWKKLGNLMKGPVSKLNSIAAQKAMTSKLFAYQTRPFLNGLAKVSKKAFTEGFEEQFQESWEEWANKKAYYDKTGQEYDGLIGGFWEFFNSKENQNTRILSAALGGLMGGGANIKSSFNKMAEENYRLFDQGKNLSEIVNKKGTDKELEFQQYAINDHLRRIVADDMETLIPGFLKKLEENENITEEERKDLEATVKVFQETKALGKRLNVKGMQALLYNKHMEYSTEKTLEEDKKNALQKIKDVEALEDLTQSEKNVKIRQISKEYEAQLAAKSEIIAKAKQNQSNLIIGKKADVIKAELDFDENGNEIIRAGLNEEEYFQFTKKGQEEGAPVKPKKKFLSFDNLTSKGKENAKKIKEKFGLGDNNSLLSKVKNAFFQSEEETTKDGEEKTPEQVAKEDTKETAAENEAEGKPAEPTLKASKSENETISDEEYQEIISDGLSPERLADLAKKVKNKETLTDRESEAVVAYKGIIQREIARNDLGTKKAFKNTPNKLDDLSKQDIDNIQKEYGVVLTRNEDGTYDVKTPKGNFIKSAKKKADIEAAIDNKVEENLTVEEEEDLSEEENKFVKEEAESETSKKKTISDEEKANLKRAVKKLKVDPDADLETLDSRKETKQSESVKQQNIREALNSQAFSIKMLDKKFSGEIGDISQQALDNYINTNSMRNLMGPGNLEKMAVVNHHLKNMFEGTDTPAQVIIVQNLYKAIGSTGLGSVVGMTMFIDEKSWEDSTYMHELSHIFFRLAKKEPIVQQMIKDIILDRELMKATKAKYDDYTLYNIVLDGAGNISEITKGQIQKQILGFLPANQTVEDYIVNQIKLGNLKRVPLSKQRLLIEEAFVSKIEKPLDSLYDKVFNARNEVKRKADVTKFFGLLKRKGDIIKQDEGLNESLKKLFETNENGPQDLKSFFIETFKAVTKGVQLDSYALDSRADEVDKKYNEALEEITVRKEIEFENNPNGIKDVIAKSTNKTMDKIRQDLQEMEMEEFLDEYENQLEDTGEPFYNKEFDTHVKSTTRIMRRFGTVYNRVMRSKAAINWKRSGTEQRPQLFNQDQFDSFIFNLAKENNTSKEFIYHIENSELMEVQAFNRYLDSIFPEQKLILLSSMHYVMSNAKHVNGVRTVVDSNRKHKMENSLSTRELSMVDRTLKNLAEEFTNKTEVHENVQAAMRRIYQNFVTKEDILTILEAITPYEVNLSKIIDDGYITFRGRNIPLDQLIAGYVKKGLGFSTVPNKQGKRVLNTGLFPYAYAFRPLIQAIIDTDRKYSFRSSVKNAENNFEPVRITNNLLTNELDEMFEFLNTVNPNTQENPTLEDFLDKYSHNETKEGKNIHPNLLLKHIYEQNQKGIRPSIVQYHGIEHANNDSGNTFQKSTSLEQGIEDFGMFLQTALKSDGSTNKDYLGAMLAFSDSPRKFYMSMKRIAYGEIFNEETGFFNQDGKLINNLYDLNNKIYGDTYGSKQKFKEAIKKSITDTIEFIENNAEQIMGLELSRTDANQTQTMDKFFDPKTKKLNDTGRKLVTEYAVSTIANGFYMADVFAPKVAPNEIIKRFKANLSPVLSIKNKNLRLEAMVFADRAGDGKFSTDSGMYILKEQADLLARIGMGIFEMNNGFKLLNASIEKDNPKLKDNLAYLKGYTTIVEEGHPLYKVMKARLDKYNKWHEDTYYTKPSNDFTDGLPNNIIIGVPASADKGGMFTENSDYDPKFTEDYLNDPANLDEANAYYDKFAYPDGKFQGLSAYNFGPQQLMDKITKTSNTPVQLINGAIVNARINGSFELANEIQTKFAQAKLKHLYETIKRIEKDDPKAYKKFIEKGLNKEAMDQAQRIIFDDMGSISNPYLVEITTNQLAKTLRNAGNKLKTKGTYAHQKPDTDWIYNFNNKVPLKGYQDRGLSGGLIAAEMVAPGHLADQSFAREKFTFDSPKGKQVINSSNTAAFTKKQLEEYNKALAKDKATSELFVLAEAAKMWASKRHKVSMTEIEKNMSKYIGEERAPNGDLIGFHSKGEFVIATRVPSHGPSMTGVYEIIGYNRGDGNQVSVAGEMNKIMGSDNDGDALFIQQKSFDNSEIDQALDLIMDYWLSPEMKDQVTAVFDVKGEGNKAIDRVKEKFDVSENKHFPFSPLKRQEDYNNTMVSKRNVGPVFNIHKVTNLLAAYGVQLKTPITINGIEISGFKDVKTGPESRNMQSALLANIILDNSRWFFADKLGINEHTINESALLVNLGLNLGELGLILNSPAAKLYSEFRRAGDSMYHENINNNTLFERVEKTLARANELMNADKSKNKKLEDYIFIAKKQLDSINYKYNVPSREVNYNVDIEKTSQFSEQFKILDLFKYLNEMTSEVQAVSGIMSGHNKVHVNPLVLNEQLNRIDEILNNQKPNQILQITDEFKSNPDIQNYRETAQQIFNKVKIINPVYHNSTNELLSNLKKAINPNLGIKHIENISGDILLFQTARLLGHNNLSQNDVENILKDKGEDSVFVLIDNHIGSLRKKINAFGKNNRLITDVNKSILFTKALSVQVDPNSGRKYISANSDFLSDSFTPLERKLAQEEFASLPEKLKNALMVYDLIERGFKGKISIMPFLDESFMSIMNTASDKNMFNKDNKINSNVISQLEKAIVLRMAKNNKNPLNKVFTSQEKAPITILNDTKIMEHFRRVNDGEMNPVYVNVISDGPKKSKIRSLYKINPLSLQQQSELDATNYNKASKRKELLKDNIELISSDLSSVNSKINIAIINDKSTGSPTMMPPTSETGRTFFMNRPAGDMFTIVPKIKPELEGETAMDAREDFYVDSYTKKKALTKEEYIRANEFNPYVKADFIDSAYASYKVNKEKANQLINNGFLDTVQNASLEKLYDLYYEYGQKEVYAYAGILMPITKRIAEIKMQEQMQLHKRIQPDGKDISVMQAYMMSGSTIPSNHPASQALAREMEKKYKVFINEKKKYISKLNDATEKLYKDRLGYGAEVGLFKGRAPLKNLWNKIKNTFKEANVYQTLYGNLVTRKEYINDFGTAVVDFKLKDQQEIESLFKRGEISQAEKEFYDVFREISEELKPKNLSKEEKNYIPHTSMSKLELLSSKGLLGLLANSRTENESLYDVKMQHQGKLKSWKQIEDHYKIMAGRTRNNLDQILEFKKLKLKAKKLLEKGINEDGSRIETSGPLVETALGFGAINRFAHNRSVKATEIPSMDLNKAMADYIHSTLFVNGNENFEGMEKLQAQIEGVLAWNSENNLPQMNKHIQTVWKDYFLRQKRQTSVLGDKADRVILGLTRLNLFYALGWSANVNTGGLYVIGNILAGKYHNIKNQGGKNWIKGEARFWGLDKGLKSPEEILQRMKRNRKIMKTLNFMEINVYDEVSIEKKNGLDTFITDLALAPMIKSEEWIQQVHMLGMLTDEDLAKFDDNGNWINENDKISNDTLIKMEDEIKASHGRGYQPTDQRAVQMYSYGTMMLQFARFIPTLFHDRFAKADVNIYGQETIGSLRAVSDMVKYVANNPNDFINYRKNLTPEMRSRLDQGLKGMAMTTLISMFAGYSETARELLMDTSYYVNHEKLSGKIVPPAIQSINMLLNKTF